MPRGRPPISQTIKSRIAKILNEHPTWTAKEIEAEARKQLGQSSPSLSKTNKLLPELRRRREMDEFLNLEQPWSIGSLIHFPICQEAVPFLVELNTEQGVRYPITIREARWLAYLLQFTKLKALVGTVSEDLVIALSLPYCARERAAHLTDSQLDTRDLDSWLDYPLVFVSKFKDELLPLFFSHHRSIPTDSSIKAIYRDLGVSISVPAFKEEMGLWQYALWLPWLPVTQRWEELSTDERKDLLIRLEEEIKQDELDGRFRDIPKVIENLL